MAKTDVLGDCNRFFRGPNSTCDRAFAHSNPVLPFGVASHYRLATSCPGNPWFKAWQGSQRVASLLWMDEILHHFETMNHCFVVFPGEFSFQGLLGGARFRPSTVWRSVKRKHWAKASFLKPAATLPLRAAL